MSKDRAEEIKANTIPIFGYGLIFLVLDYMSDQISGKELFIILLKASAFTAAIVLLVNMMAVNNG